MDFCSRGGTEEKNVFTIFHCRCQELSGCYTGAQLWLLFPVGAVLPTGSGCRRFGLSGSSGLRKICSRTVHLAAPDSFFGLRANRFQEPFRNNWNTLVTEGRLPLNFFFLSSSLRFVDNLCTGITGYSTDVSFLGAGFNNTGAVYGTALPDLGLSTEEEGSVLALELDVPSGYGHWRPPGRDNWRILLS
jgi:hypothetical protein